MTIMILYYGEMDETTLPYRWGCVDGWCLYHINTARLLCLYGQRVGAYSTGPYVPSLALIVSKTRVSLLFYIPEQANHLFTPVASRNSLSTCKQSRQATNLFTDGSNLCHTYCT